MVSGPVMCSTLDPLPSAGRCGRPFYLFIFFEFYLFACAQLYPSRPSENRLHTRTNTTPRDDPAQEVIARWMPPTVVRMYHNAYGLVINNNHFLTVDRRRQQRIMHETLSRPTKIFIIIIIVITVGRCRRRSRRGHRCLVYAVRALEPAHERDQFTEMCTNVRRTFLPGNGGKAGRN